MNDERTNNKASADASDNWEDTYVSAWSVEEHVREIRQEIDEIAAHAKAILHNLVGTTTEDRVVQRHVNAIIEGVTDAGDRCVDLIGLALDGRSESEIAAAPAVGQPEGAS